MSYLEVGFKEKFPLRITYGVSPTHLIFGKVKDIASIFYSTKNQRRWWIFYLKTYLKIRTSISFKWKHTKINETIFIHKNEQKYLSKI